MSLPTALGPTTPSSPELARHHLDQHPCPSTGHYAVVTYRCDFDGATARVVECEVCGEVLVAEAGEPTCEHLPELLGGLGVTV